MTRAPVDPLLLGVDLGAGALKALLIEADGTAVGQASSPVATLSPQPGWSEQDPDEWWRAARAAIGEILAATGADPRRIAGLSFSAGAHTAVIEDAQGRVVRRAILWNDQRSWQEARRLEAEHGKRIAAIAGNRPTPTWTLPHFAWLQAHEPEVARQAARVFFAKDWLRSRFTGDWVTDPVDAEGSLFYDRDRHRPSAEICATIGWDADTLPPVRPMADVVGEVGARAAAETGLAAGTPVVCGTSDTAIETYAAGMDRPGVGVLKLATAATVAVLTDEPVRAEGVIAYSHVIPKRFYAILGTNSCASAHRWLRDTTFSGLDPRDAYGRMDALAAEVGAGSDGLFFHPYLNGERSPHWDPRLRASFVGAGFGHGPGHLVRALYEGIGYSIRDCYGALEAAGLGIARARLTGGGSRSTLWRQILADILGVEVELPETSDASFGAALVAGIGTGIFSDAAAALGCLRIADVRTPDAAAVERYREGFDLYRRIQAALAPVHHEIHDWRSRG